jgi:hypothetical protein
VEAALPIDPRAELAATDRVGLWDAGVTVALDKLRGGRTSSVVSCCAAHSIERLATSETGSDPLRLSRNEIDPGSANHTCLSFFGLSQSRVELGVYKPDDTF